MEMKKQIANLFNKVAPVFDGSGPRIFQYFGERLVELSEIKKDEKILDVASGKGASFFPSIEKVGKAGKVIGIDISEGMVTEINLLIQRRGVKNVKVMVMDAEKLEFSNKSFEHILCGFGVFFFPNYEVALGEFMRVLKIGGKFSFTTFLNEKDGKFKWLEELVEKYLPGFQAEGQESKGPQFDTEEGLYEILKVAGFKNIKVLSEEKTFIYKDEQEWWDKLWTHGYIRVMEMIPKEKLEDFRIEVFQKLTEIKESDGISATIFVLYGFGEK